MEKHLARTICQFLQADPWYYRHFGPYWWRLKRLIQKTGYASLVFGLAGNYTDEAIGADFDDMDEQAFLEEALTYQQMRVAYYYHDPWHEYNDEAYYLHDPDLEV